MRSTKLAQNNIGRMLFLAFALTLVLAVTVTPAVHAGEYIDGSPDAELGEGEVVEDDLFIGGNSVLVAGVVEGDLFAGGQDVVISGEVYGNVYAAGEQVTISGYVEGSVVLAGYSLVLEDGAEIGHNVYFGGFSLEAEPESIVSHSVYGGGYQLILDGTVDRDVTAGLAALAVNGPVGGDIRAEVGESTGNVDVVTYWSWDMPRIEILDPGYQVDEEMVEGLVDITVTQVDTNVNVPEFRIDPAYYAFQRVRQRMGEFVALLLVGALLLWLMKDVLLKTVGEVRTNGGVDFLWGMLVFVLVIPVFFTLFLVLLAVTILFSLMTLGMLTGELIAVGTFLFAGLSTLFSLLTGLGTKIIVGYLVGRWLLEKITQLDFSGYWHHFAALASGVFIYELLRAVPVFGWFVQVVVVLIGTGAIFVLVKNALSGKPPQSAEAEAVVAEPAG